MRFLHPDILIWLAAIPVLILVFIVGSRIIKARLARFGGSKISQMAERSVSGSKRRLKFILTVIGLTLMIFALARPQYGSELIKIKSTGTEVMIALDASLSMLAGDFYPNRLDKAKREIITLVDNLPGESVGLVIFTGQAFVQCPLTIDHDALRMFLDVVRVGIISDTGTNLERAIEKAAENFTPDTQADKVLVIFTDGESQEGDAVAAAKKYKDQFRIFTVGVGTAQGEPIPIRAADGSIDGYKKDQNDQTVISKLNEPLLREIASAADGSSYRATPGEQELKTIVQRIKRMEKGETEGNYRRIYDEKFQYFLIPGIIFIGLALFVGERKNHA
jgi:Ca-activated chloride channel family protein